MFPLIDILLVLLKDFLKTCRFNSLLRMKYGQNSKKMKKNVLPNFSSKFYGHMLISLNVISVLQKKKIEEMRQK